MSQSKSIFGTVAAIVYFIFVMWWVLLFLFLVPLGLVRDIKTVLTSGFSSSNIGATFVGVFGFFIGLSLLIPAFRRIYYRFPWMFAYVKILYLDVIIISIATLLLNLGFQISNSSRHILFIVLMSVQIIVCRIAMCIYLNKKPVIYIGGKGDGQ